MRHLSSCFRIFCILFCISLTGSLYSQAILQTNETPYQAVYTHLYYLQSDSYDPGVAAKSFEWSNGIDSVKAVKLAFKLKQVLDGKGLFVRMADIPTEANYQDSIYKKAIFTLFPQELPEIYLEKSKNNWYYSKETAKSIDRIHKSVFPYGSNLLVNLFPDMNGKRFFGLATWQYFGIFLLLLLAALLYLIFKKLIAPLLHRALNRWADDDIEKQKKNIKRIASVFSLLSITQVVKYLIPVLLLPIQFSEFAFIGISIFQIVFIAFLLIHLSDLFVGYFIKMTLKTENTLDDQLMPLLHKIIRIVIYLGAILQILHIMDVNVTALIAGLSIGGLALALAAQDAVKNFIGSIMIILDQPFKIGDYIIGSGFEGSVEEVGFRTSRIRSVDTSIISVPNGQLSNQFITNLGVRHYRMFNTKLTVTYDSSPERLEQFIEGLKQIILNTDVLLSDKFYVHLNEMSDSSLNIMFRTYMDVSDYAIELETKEKIIFEIIRLADFLGIEFAFPSRSLYIEQMTRADKTADSSSGRSDKLNLDDFFKK